MYHAVYTFDEQLKLSNKDYVEAVSRWIPIVNEFEDMMKSVSTQVKDNTTEEMIYSMLTSKYDEDKSVAILEGLINRIKK